MTHNSAQAYWQNMLGETLGTSDWFVVDQARIDAFARATLDQQFIHIDPVAAAKTELGGTIAHGMLIQSLVPQFLYPMLEGHIADNCTLLNYGTDKVRFITPVPSGAAISCQIVVQACEQKETNRLLLHLNISIDIQNETRPAMIADALLLILEDA